MKIIHFFVAATSDAECAEKLMELIYHAGCKKYAPILGASFS